MTITATVGWVRIEARDSSAGTLTPHVDTPTRHRGLHLTEDLFDDRGVEAEDPGGKIVWCDLPSKGVGR